MWNAFHITSILLENNTVKITRTSPITGVTNTLDVDCTSEQLEDWEAGTLIQDAMPNVPAPLREFLMTGTTPSEWTAMFGRPSCARCRVRRSGRRG